MRRLIALSWGLLSLVVLAADDGPAIQHVGMVAPDVIGITIKAGRVELGHQEPYIKQTGDSIDDKNGRDAWVKRGGKAIGGLVGKDRALLQTFDKVVGDALDTKWADQPGAYALKSAGDAAYKDATAPTAVFRKTRPTDSARTDVWAFQAPTEHTIYLKLPKGLTAGKEYTLSFKDQKFPECAFTYDPAKLRSEALHVSFLGFRPDDPAKVAFLSCWLGSGGPQRYEAGMSFHVLDDKTGQSVFDGKSVLSKAGEDKTEDPYKRNYNLVDVFALDFSALDKPGTYRVNVDGVGCSYPFEISAESWRKDFLIAAKAFYHQRSGISLGPPYTTFKRPRCFHPDDGVKVYASTCSLMGSGNGLNANGTDKGNFGNLVNGKTDQIVPNAWGGYFDAGDWDRRVQHLDATRLMLELAELFPEFVASAALNIPETGNGLPDIVNEALWNLDFYRRLQMPDGAIRGGIEQSDHPRFGEASWQESQTVMSYAPDPWSSFVYASVAARAAGVLNTLKPELAKTYRDSALKAMAWGEAEYAKTKNEKLPHAVRDARNLASAELLRLTGESKWQELFAETCMLKDAKAELAIWQSHDQRDAAFVYVRIKQGADASLQKNAREALLREADATVVQGEKTAFHWTKPNPWAPVGWGMLGVPNAVTMLRAHALTGQAKYLKGSVLACQLAGGANPMNMCYTVGIGPVYAQNPLVVDARISRQPTPPGITVFGPSDVEKVKNHWLLKAIPQTIHPPVAQWPTTEAYWDVFWVPEQCEFTIMQTLGPNTYVWGYLAARK